MIKSFADKTTERLWLRQKVSSVDPRIQRAVIRKLTMIHAATELETLRIPPGNHLEALKGNRAGQHSIRVNNQWRICFTWLEEGAYDVELVDYH